MTMTKKRVKSCVVRAALHSPFQNQKLVIVFIHVHQKCKQNTANTHHPMDKCAWVPSYRPKKGYICPTVPSLMYLGSY